MRFLFRKRLISFKYAIQGLKALLKNEHNARIHLVAALLALAICFWLPLSLIEWVAIILVILFVFFAELLNSSIEALADEVTKEKNNQIKLIKDYGAAAVLIASLIALIVGLAIFIPKIIDIVR